MSKRSPRRPDPNNSYGGADVPRLIALATSNTFVLGARTAGLATLAALTAPNPFIVGLISAAGFLPWLLIGPWVGYLIDRTTKVRLIQLGSLLAVAFCAVGVVIVALTGASWGLVLALSLALGSIHVPLDTSINSLLPQLVDDEHLARVNGNMSAWQSSASIFAPAVAGFFLGYSDLAMLILLIAVWGGMALLCTKFRVRGAGPSRPKERATQNRLHGLRLLWDDSGLAALATSVSLMNIYSGILGAMLPLYVLAGPHGSVQKVGLVLAVQAIGLLGGVWGASLLIARFGRAPRILLVSAAAMKLPVFLLVVVSDNIVVVIAAALLNGLSAGMWNAPSSTALIRGSKGDFQSHVIAAYKMIASLGAPFGALLGGVVSAGSNIQVAFAIGLVFSVLVVGVVYFRRNSFDI